MGERSTLLLAANKMTAATAATTAKSTRKSPAAAKLADAEALGADGVA
jgi:hypothetical protein